MNYEELNSRIQEIVTLVRESRNYTTAEVKARELLQDKHLKEYPELHCNLLFALCGSLWQRGLGKEAMTIAQEALHIASTMNKPSLRIRSYRTMGVVYRVLADYTNALDYLHKALTLAQESSLRADEAQSFDNIGVLYYTLGDYPKALEYMNKALALHEEIGNSEDIIHSVGNIGTVYYNLGDYSMALEYMQRSLAYQEEQGNKPLIALFTGNIGNVYIQMGDYNKGLEYMYRALALAEELDMRSEAANITGNIGTLYAEADKENYDVEKAIEYLNKSLSSYQELGLKSEQIRLELSLANIYQRLQDWERSDYHFRRYHDIEKEVLTIEAKEKAEQLDAERKNAEREKQLAIERTRFQERENILNNILPEEITTRLIKGENPIADHFDSVSILFMDIVDFTSLSTAISAQQLVHLLNAIFTAADGVMREFGLEKIKTIGDAYMAVAGAPIVQEDHASRAVQAALKLLEVINTLAITLPENYNDRAWIESLPEIDVRIGVHCGPVAAGVVGENKFLYDLWGDAVNTAARMESHGETGRIHVSEEFVRQLTMNNAQWTMLEEKENQVLSIANCQLSIIPRGEIEIKGKGLMQTFFLERVL